MVVVWLDSRYPLRTLLMAERHPVKRLDAANDSDDGYVFHCRFTPWLALENATARLVRMP